MEDENLVIEEAKKGNQEAYRKIIDNYKNYVFAIILNFVKDYGEVENIAQEVFFQIYKSLPKYESDNFKGWIGRITSNKSIDYIRNINRNFKEETMEDSEIIIEKIAIDETRTPEEEMIEREKESEFIEMCEHIPDIYRQTIIKHYIQGKSYKEISDEENISPKTVESRLYRGRLMLRDKWRDNNEAL